MTNQLITDVPIMAIEDTIAHLVDAIVAHLAPLIAYLEQHAKTEAEAAQLQNAYDALADVRAAKDMLVALHLRRDDSD